MDRITEFIGPTQAMLRHRFATDNYSKSESCSESSLQEISD